MNTIKLPRSFFTRDAQIVARELLGKLIIKGNLIGMITETEAYKSRDDDASHASKGITSRNRPMFEIGGYSYVYFIYGMYYCFNITTGEKGQAGAVLIRGVKPLKGEKQMKLSRKYKTDTLKNLTNGPGKFCQAFGINRSYNHIDILSKDSPIQIFQIKKEIPGRIVSTPRIGIKKATDKKWRFVLQTKI